MDNYPEGEIKEMIEIYEKRGMDKEDAVLVVETMAKYKDFFVDVMMKEELELQVPEDDHIMGSMKEGVVMFCSFAIFGSCPLLGYVIIPIAFPNHEPIILFTNACVVTGIVLFCMGCMKSKFSNAKWYLCGLETFLLGGACATVAFAIGLLVDRLVADSSQ